MKTLETYLRENVGRNVIDHHIRARVDSRGDVVFYIHALYNNSDTLDFQVNGDALVPDPNVIRVTNTDVAGNVITGP